jgi:hypothetical protein
MCATPTMIAKETEHDLWNILGTPETAIEYIKKSNLISSIRCHPCNIDMQLKVSNSKSALRDYNEGVFM